MNNAIKIGLYVTFTIAACVFGNFARSDYIRLMDETDEAATRFVNDPTAEGGEAEGRAAAGYASVLTFGALFFVSVVMLALLAGHDLSQLAGSKALKVLFNEEGKGVANPELEAAEAEAGKGRSLEAIRLMREYLEKNPKEHHVALRIAEIYEQDLHNQLAAALEYEEILQRKLTPERWGWAAIHLCNLYFKLQQPEKAVALLKRIVEERGDTPAAEKARKRLSQIEGASAPEAQAPEPETVAVEDDQAPPPDADPRFPPGFAPRKS